MLYLGNTFSPMMLEADGNAIMGEYSLDAVKKFLEKPHTSVVSHEVTAPILSALLGIPVAFNRVNLTLNKGDCLICVIPAFRCNEAREFTHEEVASAGVRCFVVLAN